MIKQILSLKQNTRLRALLLHRVVDIRDCMKHLSYQMDKIFFPLARKILEKKLAPEKNPVTISADIIDVTF